MTVTDINPTLDLYREVHKGIRRALFDLCEAAGALDSSDTAGRYAFVARFAELDRLLTRHHEHEDGEALASLIAQVAPQFVGELHTGHEGVTKDLADLRSAVTAFGHGHDNADTIYDRVTSFVADYLGHMAFEESRVMPALSAGATFEQLMDAQIALRSAIPPSDMVVFMRWMLPAMNPDERSDMLGQMKAGAPTEIFDIFWSTAADVLTDDQLSAVAERVGAAPAAVTV